MDTPAQTVAEALDALTLNEVQLLLAEKRTALSTLRISTTPRTKKSHR